MFVLMSPFPSIFHGYLPHENRERERERCTTIFFICTEMEGTSAQDSFTHAVMFLETINGIDADLLDAAAHERREEPQESS